MGLEEVKYVCRVGIFNKDDLRLGPAGSSCELSWMGFLGPDTNEIRAPRLEDLGNCGTYVIGLRNTLFSLR